MSDTGAGLDDVAALMERANRRRERAALQSSLVYIWKNFFFEYYVDQSFEFNFLYIIHALIHNFQLDFANA